MFDWLRRRRNGKEEAAPPTPTLEQPAESGEKPINWNVVLHVTDPIKKPGAYFRHQFLILTVEIYLLRHLMEAIDRYARDPQTDPHVREELRHVYEQMRPLEAIYLRAREQGQKQITAPDLEAYE